jgi:uncharacterized protein with NRDE domain
MCTIIVIHGVHPQYPLIVAANRDEFHARPWKGPERVETHPTLVAGRDLERGGSWLGAHENGLVVGITNQRSYGTSDRTLRSRGEIVLDALRTGSVTAVTEYLHGLDAREFNAFNLVYGDGRELSIAYARTDSARIETQSLPPGVHVLANDRIDSPDFPKTRRAIDLVLPVVRAPYETLRTTLQNALGDHQWPDLELIAEPSVGSGFTQEFLQQLQALCIHTPLYGTGSSTIIAAQPGQVAEFLFAPGPPCRTPFENYTNLFR